MAIKPNETDQLARAVRLARESEHSEGWASLAGSIKSALRQAVTPGLPVRIGVDAEGSQSFVSTRVLLARLGRRLQTRPRSAPSDIRLRVEDAEVTGVEVQLVGSYGHSLVEEAARVRDEIRAELSSVLPTSGVDLDVDVDIVDVVLGDPRLS